MPSPIAQLRALVPDRPLHVAEGLRVAERQALGLLRLREVDGPAVGDEVIEGLPRVQVERLCGIPVSGSTHWAAGRWVIVLNADEARVRQRFSLAHEFWHILDGLAGDERYPAWRGQSTEERREQLADFFAANLLMPKAWIKAAYYDHGLHDPRALATHFDVSLPAMRLRLTQLGITEPTARCGYRRRAA